MGNADITPATLEKEFEAHRSSHELFQALGILALVVGGLLTLFLLGVVFLMWLSGSGLTDAWQSRVAWAGPAALLFMLSGVVAKSYGNRANRANQSAARRAAPESANSTLVVARECAACRTLSAVDAAVCTRCGNAL